MRTFWSLLAFSFALLPCSSVKADSALTLNDYRLKASLLPAVCAQVGGTINYATHANDCKLPTVTSRVPSAATTPTKALPITIKH